MGSIFLSENIFNYITNHRDNREMNILELYQRLNILQDTNNTKQIRKLKINIQERYTLPFSCIVFALLGAVLGCNSLLKINSFSLTVIIIFTYQVIQFLSTSFCVAGLIPINVGIWLPNMFGLSLSGIILNFNQKPR
jgi:lipopolysaccharide export system permease protein